MGKSGLLCLCCALAAPAFAAPRPVPAVNPIPAIGHDWMDLPDAIDRADDPDPWPRADAADAGIQDMIHDERRVVEEAVGAPPALSARQRADGELLRTLRKVGGDSIVVPVFTLHLDRHRSDAAHLPGR